MKIVSLLLLLPLKLCAVINWPLVIEEIAADSSSYERIHGGASNVNYHLSLEGEDYFVRFAPPNTQALYANHEIEAEVLQALSPLGVSPEPAYYDAVKRVLVMKFIAPEKEEIDLLDPATRRSVFALLHKIENSGIHIARTFQPYEDVMKLVSLSPSEDYSEEFYQIFLPALQWIDSFLAKNPYKTLCHLDLHHKNLLKKGDRHWIVDWEYAMMSHPFLVLASMASIERWDDEEMHALLIDYMQTPSEEDFELLDLYRIAIDLFWTAWNHVQSHCSPLDNPYEEWEKLFYGAAAKRIPKIITKQDLCSTD